MHPDLTGGGNDLFGYNIQQHDKTETVDLLLAAMRTKHNHDSYTRIQPRRKGEDNSRRLSVNDHDLIGRINVRFTEFLGPKK